MATMCRLRNYACLNPAGVNVMLHLGIIPNRYVDIVAIEIFFSISYFKSSDVF